jgi:hypothetical protein
MYVVKLSKKEVEFAVKYHLPAEKKFRIEPMAGIVIVNNPKIYESCYTYYCTKYFYKVLKNHMRLIESRLEKEQREYGIANKTPEKEEDAREP